MILLMAKNPANQLGKGKKSQGLYRVLASSQVPRLEAALNNSPKDRESHQSQPPHLHRTRHTQR